MAEEHATLIAKNGATTPLAISGNFSITISTDKDWKGGLIVVEKKFADDARYFPLKNGMFFRSDTMVGNEPGASVVNYRIRCQRFNGGSAYVRIEDGN